MAYLVVVVSVRVAAAANSLAVLVVSVTLVQGVGDLAGAVVVVAALGGGLTLDDFAGWGGEGRGCEQQGGDDGAAHLE